MNFRKQANPPADAPEIFDRDGQPVTTSATTGKTAAVIDLLALGAGALLGRAAKNSGTLGKLAGTLSAGRGFRR